MLEKVDQTNIPSNREVDFTLIQERLKLSPTERIQEHSRFMEFIEGLRLAKLKDDKLSRNSKSSQQ